MPPLVLGPSQWPDPDNPYIHHYPDGNAGVARSLVKHLIPQVAEIPLSRWSRRGSTG